MLLLKANNPRFAERFFKSKYENNLKDISFKIKEAKKMNNKGRISLFLQIFRWASLILALLLFLWLAKQLGWISF